MSTSAHSKAWRKRNPGYYRIWYRRNTAKQKAKTRAWAAKNPDRVREKNRRFEADNPTYFRDYQRRRRLKLAWLKFTSTCAESRSIRERGVA